MAIFGAILGAVLPTALSVVDKLIPDKDLAQKLQHQIKLALLEKESEIEQAIHEAAKAQIEVNAEEAKHPSLFVAGWRPFIGWTGGFGLAYQYLVQPFVAWVSLNAGWVAPPVLDMGTLITLLFGMLGLGAFRTYEKYQEVETVKVGRKK